MDEVKLQNAIEAELLKCSIRPNLSGFVYLADAVKIAIDNWGHQIRICKYIYGGVAEHFDTTPSRAERAMRHAIETAFVLSTVDYQNKVFDGIISADKGYPTVSEFVYTIAQRVRASLQGGEK